MTLLVFNIFQLVSSILPLGAIKSRRELDFLYMTSEFVSFLTAMVTSVQAAIIALAMTPSCDTSYFVVNFSLQLQVPLEINAIKRYCSILMTAPSMSHF